MQHNPAWYEQQYNNRARIPEHPALFQRWAQASAAAREGSTWLADQRYGPTAGQVLDVFPARAPGSPVLVFIHGGYWRSLDKADHSFVAPVFLQAGAAVVVPNYDLCPAVGIADIALQMAQALVWVHDHAADWGGDARRIVVVGHSAGAHLAAMLLACRWKLLRNDLPAHLLTRAMGISGLYDLEPLRHAPFLQADLRLDAAEARRLSPAYYARPRQGRLVAVVGADESPEFLRHNQLIRDCWGPSSVPVCEAVPGRHHLDVLHDLVDPQARLHGLALEMLGLGAART
jgi:arylformamidase